MARTALEKCAISQKAMAMFKSPSAVTAPRTQPDAIAARKIGKLTLSAA